jgi:hypothetical protein
LQIGGTKGTGGIVFATSPSGTPQLQVSHTASAVNYVQVTGAATGGRPVISTQGSDANINFTLQSKGSFGFTFQNSAGGSIATWTNAGVSSQNYFNFSSNSSGNAPTISSSGADTNIDLALTPKGTGNVRFGTYTGTALSIAGYIEIKDSGGTVRKLAVVA